jgi:hypothetical protein
MSHIEAGCKGKLEGITRHGKNRVREQGTEVQVLRVSDHVLFSSKQGPWLYVETLDGKHSRWVHATDDSNFRFIPSNNGANL